MLARTCRKRRRVEAWNAFLLNLKLTLFDLGYAMFCAKCDEFAIYFGLLYELLPIAPYFLEEHYFTNVSNTHKF